MPNKKLTEEQINAQISMMGDLIDVVETYAENFDMESGYLYKQAAMAFLRRISNDDSEPIRAFPFSLSEVAG